MTSPDLPAIIARVRELQAKANPPQTPGYVRVGEANLAEWASVIDEIPQLADECARLRRHYDAAGPEHNLLALLDLYWEREQAAKAECERLRERVRELEDALAVVRNSADFRQRRILALEEALRPFAGLPVRGESTMLLIGADEVNEARLALEGGK